LAISKLTLLGIPELSISEDRSGKGILECPALDFQIHSRSPGGALDKRSWKKRIFETIALGWQSKNIPAISTAPRCVVVATGGNLGGAILSTPLIRAMRERFPETHLAVITNNELSRQVVTMTKLADSIHIIDPPFIKFSTPLKWTKSLLALWRLRPDVLVSNHNDSIGRWLWPLRIPVRVGHVNTLGPIRLREWNKFYTHPVEHNPMSNWLAEYKKIADELGATWPGLPKLDISAEQSAEAISRLKSTVPDSNRRVVAFQVGVWEGQQWKQWPTDKLSEVISRIGNEHNICPILVGAPDSLASAESIINDNPDLPIVSFVGKTSVAEAASLLAACDGVVANDSGIMHLGPAVGTPTIGVYGMTDPAVTWPYGAPHKVVRRTDCRPCYKLPLSVMNSCSHRKCLTELTPDLVVDSIVEIIAQADHNPRRGTN